MSLVKWWSPRLAAAMLLAALLASAALAAPFALVASVQGRVEIARGKAAPVRAAFGAALERGDRVTVAPGGSATIYFSDGNVIELAEKSAVTVGGKVAASARTGPAAEIPSGVYAQVSQVVTGGSRQTGLVALSPMRSGEERAPLILEPRRADVLADRPAFAWREVPGATRYTVTLAGDAGTLWTREATGTRLEFPADQPPLARDADYLWTVDAFGERGRLHSETSLFHVVAPEVDAAVRADVASIERGFPSSDHPAAHFVRGQYEVGRGLYHDAALRFIRLSQLIPDSPAPHEALGNVYRAIGLMDLAAAEYQRALELSKSK